MPSVVSSPNPTTRLWLPDGEGAKIVTLTKEEDRCNRMLSECISMTLDDKNGYLTLTVTMPEAIVAAEMAEAAVTLLQKYITEFKIEKVQSNLDFVQERYNEAKAEFEDIQDRRARFRDANLNTTKYSARTQLEKLDAEYTLALNLYSELASKLEQAKINVKGDDPDTYSYKSRYRAVTEEQAAARDDSFRMDVLWHSAGYGSRSGVAIRCRDHRKQTA